MPAPRSWLNVLIKNIIISLPPKKHQVLISGEKSLLSDIGYLGSELDRLEKKRVPKKSLEYRINQDLYTQRQSELLLEGLKFCLMILNILNGLKVGLPSLISASILILRSSTLMLPDLIEAKFQDLTKMMGCGFT